jgi:hypothetical protein
MLDELGGGFAPGFAHRLQDASLGRAAEIIVNGW